MSEPASISAGIAGRYATALFELAKEENGLDALGADVDALAAVLGESAELRSLISSPVYSREEQARAMAAIADRLNLSRPTANTLALMANKRRLFVLPQMIRALRDLIAEERGELTVDVTVAAPLTKAQEARLADVLAKATGKSVKLNKTVDESLIGGMIVKVGSKMIDSSIRSKLASLQNAMKEVG